MGLNFAMTGGCRGKHGTYSALSSTLAETAGAETAPPTAVSESSEAGAVAGAPVSVAGPVGGGDGSSALSQGSSDDGSLHFE